MKASLFWAVFAVVVSCIALTKSSAGLQPSFMLVIWQLGLLLHRLGVKFCFAALTANTARQGGSHNAQHNSHPSKCNSVSEDEAKNVATIQHDLASIKIYSSKNVDTNFCQDSGYSQKAELLMWDFALELKNRNFSIFPRSKKKRNPCNLRTPKSSQVLPSRQGACFSDSVHWLSEQRMSQMASTNGPQEPMDPRKGIAKATMPSTIPIAPITCTCDNKIQVSYFVVVPSGKVI